MPQEINIDEFNKFKLLLQKTLQGRIDSKNTEAIQLWNDVNALQSPNKEEMEDCIGRFLNMLTPEGFYKLPVRDERELLSHGNPIVEQIS